jgi:hypothetical protein
MFDLRFHVAAGRRCTLNTMVVDEEVFSRDISAQWKSNPKVEISSLHSIRRVTEHESSHKVDSNMLTTSTL